MWEEKRAELYMPKVHLASFGFHWRRLQDETSQSLAFFQGTTCKYEDNKLTCTTTTLFI
jgi:hypothetical protein